MKKIAVLGSTGSIGVSTLAVLKDFPERFQVVALTAGKNIGLLLQQIHAFHPRIVAVVSELEAEKLRQQLEGVDVEVCCGAEGMIRCATASEVEMVVAAIVGAAGLMPTMAAIKAGKHVALANKETLVIAGSLIIDEVKRQKVNLLPVDSEHSAIFQSLSGQRREDVQRLILTASGGPFREYGAAQFAAITPAEALAHPNWEMGQKISIDSATMMNKGLEVIEARWLFDFPAEMIDVHIHPESIIHSLVEYQDGAVMAQLGVPDMKTPIAYALSWPERLPLEQPPLNLCQLGQLSFSVPDVERFPCLQLAYEALAVGGTVPAAMNGANEVAVEAFLHSRLSFQGIAKVIEKTMLQHKNEDLTSVEQALHADLWGRHKAQEFINGGLV
ncbi:1-deoxy-D-xylulose 5-phosphate reductoisomerase [Desulfuromusa kysingii]|uniref:1-deoxy-D-xylulose 5-phosphate reductoisomerase n=1 Tax=Desulfuromusa kysingii TaxID=37625 RepID=A0A1H3Y7W5_9BACT|nr:1-deoxy-D-xylulose-5-phosphate reductoisomerase [Desulfuromusa kysingii]SEA07663.1 1-deoxy-D-xylulose 5-phosphate reductoisomerase [Desulfuromusa kysingii]